MKKKHSYPDLSKAEYDILRILWKANRLSVREVHDQLSPINKWVYSTTKTMMDRMVKKGLLLRETFHGIFLYKPLISRPAGLVRMIQFFADRVLEMDYGSVVSLFAHSKVLSREEIDELEKFLEQESKRGEPK
ncbi:MAG: BlaI/MecI/CopY family transcriptional regulator [bacterium]